MLTLSALPLAVTLALQADVIAKEGTKDEVLLWTKFIERTRHEQPDGINTGFSPEKQVDIAIADVLRHEVDTLKAQTVCYGLFILPVEGVEHHLAHTFLILIDVIHQNLLVNGGHLHLHHLVVFANMINLYSSSIR